MVMPKSTNETKKKKKKRTNFDLTNWSDNSSENLPELKNIKLFQKNLKFVFFNFLPKFHSNNAA